ncbi:MULTISPECIES: hypothetical protein [Staphylococcus]|uniref:hypothetical protein n=1 Tax=Staphylococcus TaxID=1279 RepID=UPI000CD2DA5B|nr:MULTISPECIES: hypothetical protein [Staphylococcus]PNY86528.1 hypothetical protein CD172_05550 [Staphylococcus agnetis]PTJ71547.1 hypothetical protein BUZ58_07290 [Staphylococcus hyicus]
MTEEFEHFHVNTGGKKLSEEQIKEVQDFMKSKEFKKMIEETNEKHKRVMESKITDRTKM